MTAADPLQPLLKVENLRKLYPLDGGFLRRSEHFIHAVDGVSLSIYPGQSLALVGESGCGKTTTGKLLMRLFDPTSGHIFMRNPHGEMEDVAGLRGKKLKVFRSRAQMIFQDPYESLNPRKTIFDAIAEPLVVQGIGNLVSREERVVDLLDQVGLAPPASFMFRYPHELSGGQRQRVAIARALVIVPEFVVCDEPTSMLDVSIRSGVMNLMAELAAKLEVSYLYITHDLAVARYQAQDIAVMYMGKVVEMGEMEEVLQNAQHPYTLALLSAVPVPDPAYRRQPPVIKGAISRPVDPPDRCRFYERCPLADNFCRDNPHPPLVQKAAGHCVSCYKV